MKRHNLWWRWSNWQFFSFSPMIFLKNKYGNISSRPKRFFSTSTQPFSSVENVETAPFSSHFKSIRVFLNFMKCREWIKNKSPRHCFNLWKWTIHLYVYILRIELMYLQRLSMISPFIRIVPICHFSSHAFSILSRLKSFKLCDYA